MQLTPQEYIKKEFPNWDGENLSPNVWLRKMQEFAVITNSKVEVSHLLNLEYGTKNALRSAVAALYFNDSSDYKKALYQVVHYLAKIPYEDLTDEVVQSIYYLFEPT